MKSSLSWVWICLLPLLGNGAVLAGEVSPAAPGFRVLSWNVSVDAFVREPARFGGVLTWAGADVLLLDEVAPAADTARLLALLDGPGDGGKPAWHIDRGVSGGPQRGLIVSRAVIETLPDFDAVIPYPEADRQFILEHMSDADRARPGWTMDGGIPVNGAVLRLAGRRLMVVVADLQCCGDGPGSWQEYRRRAETREIRRIIRQVLARTQVDGLIVGGDFNIVATPVPLLLLAGPYARPHAGLIAAEAYHADGITTWTWDGRGTPYPSRAMDFQLYGPGTLGVRSARVLDSEDKPVAVLRRYALERHSSRRLSDHRPLVVEYLWR